MKKSIFAFPFIFLAACIKIDANDDPMQKEVEKDYLCECVYVPFDTIAKNKEEVTKFTNRLKADASFECTKLEGKYIMQYYDGTCIIK